MIVALTVLPPLLLVQRGVGVHNLAASTAAHRTSVEPCWVIRPRCTVVSDS
jgi:hypothetical protein